MPSWAPDPWRAGVSLLARMVYDEQPLALLGSVDSASTHLAEQVVAKANLPLVSPVATDKTATLAGVSWMFSCAPDDTTVARALANAILGEAPQDTVAASYSGPYETVAQLRHGLLDGQEQRSLTRGEETDAAVRRRLSVDGSRSAAGNKSALVLLATTDHESRAAAREVMRELSRRGRLPEFRFDLSADAPDATEPLRSVAPLTPGAVIVIANAEDSARLVRTVREQLGGVPIMGGPALGRSRFVELAGHDAEGVQFPLLFAPDPDDEAAARFVARFTAERQHAPDYAAALAYDATRLLVAAIRQAGPNRARIREALVRLSPWTGIAGLIAFDGTGQNRRADLRLGMIRQGAVVPVQASSAVPRAQAEAGRRGRDALVAFNVGNGVAAPSPRASRETTLSPTP